MYLHNSEASFKTFFMRFITLLLMNLAFISSYAQNITGKAKDANGQAVNGATITLYQDSSVAKLAVTKENGSYILKILSRALTV